MAMPHHFILNYRTIRPASLTRDLLGPGDDAYELAVVQVAQQPHGASLRVPQTEVWTNQQHVWLTRSQHLQHLVFCVAREFCYSILDIPDLSD